MILQFEGTINTEVGNFYINEKGVILGVVVYKDENRFSICISGQAQIKLPFVLNIDNPQPFFLDRQPGLFSLFTTTEQGNNEKVIGFLYGCDTQLIDEVETIIEKQVGDLHTAFVEI